MSRTLQEALSLGEARLVVLILKQGITLKSGLRIGQGTIMPAWACVQEDGVVEVWPGSEPPNDAKSETFLPDTFDIAGEPGAKRPGSDWTYRVIVRWSGGWDVLLHDSNSLDECRRMCRRLNGVCNGIAERPLAAGFEAMVVDVQGTVVAKG